MKKLLLFLIAGLLNTSILLAQSAKSIYVELGGPGVASFNYDSRFNGREDGIGGRIGIGGFAVNTEVGIYVPLQVNYLLGKDSRNYFEMGAGVTLVSFKRNENYFYYDKNVFESTFGHLYFGYRLQPRKGGFLFRAGLTPLFGSGFFIPYYAGVSFGYKFGK